MEISTRRHSQVPTMPSTAATRSIVTALAAVHNAWDRQTAGDAAADAAQQDQTCSHHLMQPSDGLTPTVRPPSRPSISWRHGACDYSKETAGVK